MAKDETARLSRGFGWLAALGVILVLAGLVGLIYTGVATLTSMLLFGWLLLIGGAVGLLHAIQARGTNFFWLGVVVAALNIAAGVVVIRRPEAAAEALTMFAALLFLTGGVFRLAGSLVVRGTQFGSPPGSAAGASWAWSPNGSPPRTTHGAKRTRRSPNPYNPNSSRTRHKGDRGGPVVDRVMRGWSKTLDIC
jgi:uncharacterized membrane protein HdeD (DUF308 family)